MCGRDPWRPLVSRCHSCTSFTDHPNHYSFLNHGNYLSLPTETTPPFPRKLPYLTVSTISPHLHIHTLPSPPPPICPPNIQEVLLLTQANHLVLTTASRLPLTTHALPTASTRWLPRPRQTDRVYLGHEDSCWWCGVAGVTAWYIWPHKEHT